MRKVVAAIALFVALGCAGIAEQVGELAGVEVSAKTGDEAIHPVDFPLPPPDQGILAQSMEVSVAGMETTTVVYELPENVDREAVLDTYEAVIGKLSDEVVRDEGQVTVQLDSGVMITAQFTQSEGKTMLSLVNMDPRGAGAPGGAEAAAGDDADAGEVGGADEGAEAEPAGVVDE